MRACYLVLLNDCLCFNIKSLKGVKKTEELRYGIAGNSNPKNGPSCDKCSSCLAPLAEALQYNQNDAACECNERRDKELGFEGV